MIPNGPVSASRCSRLTGNSGAGSGMAAGSGRRDRLGTRDRIGTGDRLRDWRPALGRSQALMAARSAVRATTDAGAATRSKRRRYSAPTSDQTMFRL